VQKHSVFRVIVSYNSWLTASGTGISTINPRSEYRSSRGGELIFVRNVLKQAMWFFAFLLVDHAVID